jgi:hypothetical protein
LSSIWQANHHHVVFAGESPGQPLNRVFERYTQVLLRTWVIHGPSGLAVTPQMCMHREPTSITKKQYRRFSVTAQSMWKKPAASIVAACACRNVRQVVSASRLGAGGIFRALRIRRMADALTRWPTFSSSPWILLYPHPLFSLASRSISAATSALTGGRPAWCG